MKDHFGDARGATEDMSRTQGKNADRTMMAGV